MVGSDARKDQRKRLLEAFVVGNDNLERLEQLSSGFNIFSAIGMAHQEIRHSRTLAFLLSPQNNHGLGQQFLKRFLKRAALEAQNSISAVDIDVSNFADAEIRCEWKSIDILMICPTAKIIVAVENKISAGEHGDQLSRYRRIIESHAEWAGYRKLYCFLTVDGLSPRDAEDVSYWCTLNYRMISDELEASLRTAGGALKADQHVLVSHYLELLRRRVLEDSEVAELARKIYHAHKEALDIIFEHKPDLRLELSDYLIEKITNQPELQLGPCSGKFVRFISKSWKFDTSIHATSKPFRDQYVAFEFAINTDAREPNIRLELVIGPVPHAHLINIFNGITEGLGETRILTGSHPRAWDYGQLKLQPMNPDSSDDLYKKVDEWWHGFINDDLARIELEVAAVLLKTSE